MKINTAKQLMLQGKPALGAVALFGSHLSAEGMGHCGFDFVLLDAQHGAWDSHTASLALRAIATTPAVPMVRVQKNDPYAIGSMLDRGALGIIVPMVNTAAEAREAVAAVHYQPRGSRSAGSFNAKHYGADYEDWIDDQVFLAVQIETAQAVEQAEEILAVEGVDGCWIGPFDLSYSLGLGRRNEQGKQALETAVLQVLEACRKTKKIPGILGLDDAPHWLELGFLFVTIGDEAGFIQKGAQAALQRCRPNV